MSRKRPKLSDIRPGQLFVFLEAVRSVNGVVVGEHVFILEEDGTYARSVTMQRREPEEPYDKWLQQPNRRVIPLSI